MRKTVLIKHLPVLILVLFAVMVIVSSSITAQEQERIVEKVTVTNVEVPVRVLFKGKPVTDLTQADFTVYENKKKVNINGFYKKSKTFTITQAAEAGTQVEPRTFVLVFNVSNYNTYFETAIDHLFDKILAPNDRIMVFANDKTKVYNNLKDKVKIKAQLVSDLKVEGLKAKRRLLDYIKRVETFMNVHDFKRQLGRRDSDMAGRALDFLKKYKIAWDEYQKTYLMPRVDRFYYFARFLEKLKGQKWVLNFYQFEFFPRIRPTSRTMDSLKDRATELTNSGNPTMVAQGRQLQNLMNQISSELNLNTTFPNDQITKLFYKVDATFHSFFIKSSNSAFLGDISYNEVSSDIERILKGITDITGGKNINSTDLVKSLNTVSQVEDTYYVLTYVPDNPKKAGTLKIKVNNKKYKVIYDDNFRQDYIATYFDKLEKKIETPDIKLVDFSFQDKMLAFTVKDFLMRNIEGKVQGRLKVRIRVTSKENKPLYDKSKFLTVIKKEMRISLPTFKTIVKGEYNFLIDVTDMITSKEDNFHQYIVVK
jgi:VWFA-related protein